MKSKTPLRILYILPYLNTDFGGPVSTTLSVAKELAHRGEDVTILGSDLLGKRVIHFDEVEIQIKKTVLASFAKRFNFYFSIDQIWWFIKNGKKYDRVHFQDLFIFTHIFIGLLCRLWKIPYFVTPHGSLEFSAQRGNVFLKKIIFFLGIQELIHHASAVIAVSQGEYEKLMTYHLPPKIEYISNTIDVPTRIPSFNTQKYHIPSDAQIILYLGRLHAHKRVQLLLKSFLLFERKMSKQKWILVFAGPDDGERQALETLSKRLGINQKVFFIGMIQGEEKYAILKKARIVCLLSKSEGFPTVAIEAASQGTPFLCSLECQVDSLVKAKGAIEVTAESEAVMKALIHFLQNKTSVSGLHAKQWYEKNCSPKIIGNHYVALYHQLG